MLSLLSSTLLEISTPPVVTPSRLCLDEFRQPLALLPWRTLRRVGVTEPGQRRGDELVSGDLPSPLWGRALRIKRPAVDAATNFWAYEMFLRGRSSFREIGLSQVHPFVCV